eukprot:1178830-Prorocentrum_minimum.AAC.2
MQLEHVVAVFHEHPDAVARAHTHARQRRRRAAHAAGHLHVGKAHPAGQVHHRGPRRAPPHLTHGNEWAPHDTEWSTRGVAGHVRKPDDVAEALATEIDPTLRVQLISRTASSRKPSACNTGPGWTGRASSTSEGEGGDGDVVRRSMTASGERSSTVCATASRTPSHTEMSHIRYNLRGLRGRKEA